MRDKIKAIFNESKKKTLKIGVVGYSSKNFDTKKAKEQIISVFDGLTVDYDAKDVTVVSGLTNVGVPAIAYKEAVKRGFHTVGIACKKAEEYECFKCDAVIIVGKEWGDESEKFLDSIDVIVRIGGGKQSMAEVKTAKKKGLKVVEFDLEETK